MCFLKTATENFEMKRFVSDILRSSVLMALIIGCTSGWASIPTDSAMSLTWVGQEVNHNGYPVTILHFTSNKSVEQTLEFYRSTWQNPVEEGSPGFLENSIDQWRVISRLKGSESWVVQVKSGAHGGAQGFISQMNLSASEKIPAGVPKFPRMAGSILISHTSTDGKVAGGVTLVIKNQYSVTQNAEFYKQKMKESGMELAHGDTASDNVTLFFAGGDENVDVAVGNAEDGGSVIFANIIGK